MSVRFGVFAVFLVGFLMLLSLVTQLLLPIAVTYISIAANTHMLATYVVLAWSTRALKWQCKVHAHFCF